jgi:hypothetical protein
MSPTQIARRLSSGPKGQKLDRILKDRGYGGDKVGKADLEVLKDQSLIARRLSSGPKGQKLDRILKDRGYGGDKVGFADLEVLKDKS